MFVTFHAIIFEIQTLWVVVAENVILGHSFCNQSQADNE